MKTPNQFFVKQLLTVAAFSFLFQNSYAQWSTSGNSLVAGNFLGSTNASSLVF